MADRANLFGTMYVGFYDRWNQGGTRETCWPLFEAILGIAQSKADKQFTEAYADRAYHGDRCKDKCRVHTVGTPRELEITDMSAIVREAWALMDRIGTYDYTGSEFADEMEEVNVDLVSTKTP